MKKNIEFETKVLNINEEEIIAKLRKLKARETEKYLERRIIFDIKSNNIEWVRIREENDHCTMTYKFKELHNKEVGKTEEIEVTVSNFEKAKEILVKLNFFYRTMYQEKYIQKFYLGNIEFSICTWPKLNTFLEVEGNNTEDVNKGLALLNLVGKDVGDYDIAKLYEEIGIDMNSISELKF